MTTFVLSAEPNQSLIILITGAVVVFAVLLLLIGIIKVYSMIVSGAQNKTKKPKKVKETAPTPTPSPAFKASPTPAQSSGADLQNVAVIAAAVEAFYADSTVKPRIVGIRRTSSPRSEWASAGIAQNISARRGF